MRVKILLYGRIRSTVGKNTIHVIAKGSECDVQDIKKIVFQKFPEIMKETFAFVVNQEICNNNSKVKEGDEIAFLPPISGGSFSYLTKRKISNNFIKEVSSLKYRNCGSTLTFMGRIRKDVSSNVPKRFIKEIEYTAYENMAENEIDKIVNFAKEKYKVNHIFIKHRIGNVSVGEIAFFVVVCSPHRKEGIQAISHIIEEVKSKVPIWKKEIYEDGSVNWQDGVMIK